MQKPAWISEIKAIGWDLDGTLYPPTSVPSDEITRLQYEAVAKVNSLSIEEAGEKYRETLAKLGSNTKSLTALGVDGKNFFIKLWDLLPLEKYIKTDKRVGEMLVKLSKVRHFMVSNSNTVSQIERKLSLVGVSSTIFKPIVSTVQLGVVKPDPKPFMEALRALQLQPSQVLFVGDRLATDIRGAKNVGMKTCLVYGKSDEADISLPDVYGVAGLFV